jgi:ABC-type polysaccharide/polyol phosphate transport system ATPase subunit
MRSSIEVVNITKIYRRYARQRQFATLKSALLKGSLIRDLQPDETFAALRGVSFSVPKGCTYGIVGRNGSGKSTLLKCVAGITRPNEGEVRVEGRISALIELGAGFHPEISGRENIFINGIMLGLSKREVQRRFDEIVEFAELRDFIDAPVKTYSSGMYMRLGFAVAIHVDPDVLLIDEVLAVGDQAFTAKCLDKFAEFRRRRKTILLVTHALELVERFCDLALWLDKGRTLAEGEPKRVVAAYLIDVAKAEERQLAHADRAALALAAGNVVPAPAADGAVDAPPAVDHPATALGPVHATDGRDVPSGEHAQQPLNMFEAIEGRWGSREIEITEVALVGADGTPRHVFQSGDALEIRLETRAHQRTTDFVFGIGLFNADGVCCYGTNTSIEDLDPVEMSGTGEVRFRIASLDLVEGTYKVDVAAHRLDGYPYDYHRLLYTFRVKSRTRDVGIYRPAHQWDFTSSIRFKEPALPAEVELAQSPHEWRRSLE